MSSRLPPDGLENVGSQVMSMLRESTQQLMTINLCEFMAVIAHEMKFGPHEADGPIRDSLAAWAAECDALMHLTCADERRPPPGQVGAATLAREYTMTLSAYLGHCMLAPSGRRGRGRLTSSTASLLRGTSGLCPSAEICSAVRHFRIVPQPCDHSAKIGMSARTRPPNQRQVQEAISLRSTATYFIGRMFWFTRNRLSGS